MKKWERIFIIVNVVIIVAIISLYVYRGIYYYQKLNGKPVDSKLVTMVTSSKNIVYHDDGLYKVDDVNYYYRGIDVNNYVYYSGRLWRIVGVNDKGIELITDESQNSLIWSKMGDFSSSVIYKWLNDNFIGDISKEYLVMGEYCNSLVEIDNYECTETFSSLVGLLSVEEYKRSLGKDGYLNNESYYWLVNKTLDDKPLYVYSEGGVNDDSYSGDTYYSYGVRPVIYLSLDTPYVSGDGSVRNPYIIKDDNYNSISEYNVGSYVKYNDYIWRILEQGDDYTKIIMNGVIEGVSLNYNDSIKYLYNDFLNEFNKDELVKISYVVNKYNSKNEYNYLDKVSERNDYVGIPMVGELFSTGFNAWTNSYYDMENKLIYTSLDNGEIYGDLMDSKNSLRPIIAIKNELMVLEGTGTKEAPILVGDVE